MGIHEHYTLLSTSPSFLAKIGTGSPSVFCAGPFGRVNNFFSPYLSEGELKSHGLGPCSSIHNVERTVDVGKGSLAFEVCA